MRPAFCLLVFAALAAPAQPPRQTQNVVILMTDGLRWPEVFSGADAALLDRKAGGVAAPAALRKQFWREAPEDRRAALLPFFWSVVAREGQIFGDRSRRVQARPPSGMCWPGNNAPAS